MQLNDVKAPEHIDEAKARAGMGCDQVPRAAHAG
jgi:hypothetical protein